MNGNEDEKLKIHRNNGMYSHIYLWAGRIISLSLEHLFLCIQETKKTHTLTQLSSWSFPISTKSHLTAQCFFFLLQKPHSVHESRCNSIFKCNSLLRSLVVMYLFSYVLLGWTVIKLNKMAHPHEISLTKAFKQHGISFCSL